ncbi:MAG: YraN family protein [Jatrophihabitans sp.]|nr:MAG: YraN family protein [Jatrophihabitans sp.]
MRVKDAVGRFGEQLAERHLVSAGMTVLDRNWRCPEGELDLVVRDGPTIAFVEVKTRSTLAFGHPAEAVTARKAARIHRLAMRWLARWQRENGSVAAIRFDLVSVVRLAPGGPSVVHLPGAF